jgi:hypothetical protein
MGKLNLSEAAKEILGASVASKRGGQDAPKKLSTDVAYGTKDAGKIGDSPETLGDHNPDYTKGTPSATPPGATPPVGSEPAHHLDADKDQQSKGRSDLTHVDQADANNYDEIRDRKPSKLAKQTMEKNPGATFQTYGEDMDALFAGESLSEDFKSKATTIFEAAVLARAEEVISATEAQLTEQFEEAIEQVKEDLAAKVDDYLNYMVEEWIKENEIAIETGLRAEIVEDFIDGLKNLFTEHYIDIPADKVDVVEELTAKVEELEASLNEQINSAVELSKSINEHKKTEAIHAVCEGLTQTQVEKMKSLAEGVEFTTEQEFADKLNTLKESYFKADVKVADNSALDDEVQIEEETATSKKSADPLMEQYVKSISQTLVK